MKNFVMNERELAENILNGGEFTESSPFVVNVLAKYYKSLGNKNPQIKNEIERFLAEHLPNISSKIKPKIIQRAIETASKYPLYEIDGIIITKPEIEKINSLKSAAVKDYRLRRIAFALLCFSKYFALRGTKDGWINSDWSDIFAAADFRGLNTERKTILIRELIANGVLHVPVLSKRACAQVLFAQDGEPEISVDNINEVGYIFEEYEGKRFVKCQRCRKRVPVKNGRTKLCKTCAVIVGREKSRERMRMKREQENQISA